MSEQRTGICCGGNWIIDHVKTITFWPEQDTLTNIVAEELGTGGSAYNVLVDLSLFSLGIPLEGIGLVGDDADGERILADLRKRGIDSRFVRKSPGAPTSYTDVMTVRGTARRTFFHNRGANALLEPKDFPVDEVRAKVFNLGYLLLLDRLDEPDPELGTKAARVLERFSRAGILTSLDVVSEDSDRFASIVTPALPHVDYCIVNEIEAGRTTGIEIRRKGSVDFSSMEKAARELLRRGVRRLACVHAPEGSLGISTTGEHVLQPAHDLSPGFIKGTAGAGDAFIAGMLAGVHEGWALVKSLRFATAAAATCLRHPTTTSGVGNAEEIWRLAETTPYRKD